jgi:hypothetical protein
MEVRMNKFILALFVGVFSLGALACGGSKDKEKEKEKEDKRFTEITKPI